jgi:hypothetical protein
MTVVLAHFYIVLGKLVNTTLCNSFIQYYSTKQTWSSSFTTLFGAVTRMEETQRIQRSRKGHRAHLTKVLNKATTIMENDEAPNAMQIASLTATIEQLARKRTVLNELNEKLLAMVKDPDELEQEIMEAEDIECEINEKSAQISAFVLSCNTVKNPVISQVNAPQVITSPLQVNAPQVITSPQQVSAPQVITPPQQENSPQTIPSLQVSESHNPLHPQHSK